MTMDMNLQRVREPPSVTSSPTPQTLYSPPRTTFGVKRSFDVAFLMAPDDNSKKEKHLKITSGFTTNGKPQQLSPPLLPTIPSLIPTTLSLVAHEVDFRARSGKSDVSGTISPSLRGYDTSSSQDSQDALLPTEERVIKSKPQPHDFTPARSAFTKVSKSDRTSPGSSMLPSLTARISPESPSYQTSLSSPVPSPNSPVPPLPYIPPPPPAGALASVANTKAFTMPLLTPATHHSLLQSTKPYSTAAAFLLPGIESSAATAAAAAAAAVAAKDKLNNNSTTQNTSNSTAGTGASFMENYLKVGPQSLYSDKDLAFQASAAAAAATLPTATGLSKLRPMLYPEAYNLATYPYAAANFPPSPAELLTRPPPFLTAAPVSSLLPPSFAALTLPAQNVCAKCNISFRMTSDLVYHMRSHHKGENDPLRRKREEKLKCPVCNESFRERHHLTRHMTAHQDKEDEGEGAGK